MLVTVVDGDQRAAFSIATTPKRRGGRNSFSWIAPLFSWYIPYNAEEVSSTIFKVFGMTQPGIEPKSPRPLVNTLPARPMSGANNQ